MGLFSFIKKGSPLEKRIGYCFSDKDLLRRALTHRSRLNESDGIMLSNERLEFLGDAVLEIAVADHLFREFPDSDEGELTEMRRILVNGKLLADKADAIGLGRELLLSDSESDSGGRYKRSILADGYEALIGAIYMDGGLPAAEKFIEEKHLADRDFQLESERHINYKGELFEHFQARGKRPHFEIIGTEGPDHRKVFVVTAMLGKRELGRGSGKSKKVAEQNAAKEALKRTGRD